MTVWLLVVVGFVPGYAGFFNTATLAEFNYKSQCTVAAKTAKEDYGIMCNRENCTLNIYCVEAVKGKTQ